jgi:hypothetical protein
VARARAPCPALGLTRPKAYGLAPRPGPLIRSSQSTSQPTLGFAPPFPAIPDRSPPFPAVSPGRCLIHVKTQHTEAPVRVPRYRFSLSFGHFIATRLIDSPFAQHLCPTLGFAPLFPVVPHRFPPFPAVPGATKPHRERRGTAGNRGERRSTAAQIRASGTSAVQTGCRPSGSQ